MHRIVFVALWGVAFVPPASGHPPRDGLAAQDDPAGAAEREVRELERRFSDAVVRSDRAFFERVLADDFTHTSHSGAFKTKSEWMAESKFDDPQADPGAGPTRYESLDVDDLQVRIYGDTAVVTGRTTPKGRNAKGEPITGHYRYLRVWAKREGQWRAVAFQGTRIAQS
jgi:ketosteroid isomerase-like protein